MTKNGLVKTVMVAAGFLLLSAAFGLGRDQTIPPSAAPPKRIASPATRPRNNTPPPDFFAGLKLTDDQKAKIDQIHSDTKSHMDTVAHDKNLSPDAKDAFLRGYRRLENGKVFEVLTPEQQREVRRRIAAWRATSQQNQPQLRQPQPPGGKPQPQ